MSTVYDAPSKKQSLIPLDANKIDPREIPRRSYRSPKHRGVKSPKRATPARHVVSNPEIGLICPPKFQKTTKPAIPISQISVADVALTGRKNS